MSLSIEVGDYYYCRTGDGDRFTSKKKELLVEMRDDDAHYVDKYMQGDNDVS